MNARTTTGLALMTVLLCASGAVAAEPDEKEAPTVDCPPVWFDTSGNPHVDLDCINGPLFANSP